MASMAACFERVMLDPLSYIHPRRLRLPCGFNTPRQRATVNAMLLDSFDLSAETTVPLGPAARQLLMHWQNLPYVCTLAGAHLLKPELAWQGGWLKLSAPVRFFMSLPLRNASARDIDLHDARAIDEMPGRVQAIGLCHLLDWQSQTSSPLLARMRLLFAPEFDACFQRSRQPSQPATLFLILQAIQYAKNYPDDV